MQKEKQITIEKVLSWIVNHQNDTECINMINKTTFPFTSKYADWRSQHNQNNVFIKKEKETFEENNTSEEESGFLE